MMTQINTKHKTVICLFATMLFFSACESFLEIEPPKSKVYSETVFRNEGTAVAAVVGLYHKLALGFAGSATGHIGVYAGMSADEITFIPRSNAPQADREEINQNAISPDNNSVLTLWTNMYSIVYAANAILEQLEDNSYLSSDTQKQLQGEARFIRAFTFFYLVNLFGEVPLVTTTDYRANAALPISPADQVYELVMEDLEEAVHLLSPSYVGSERLRVNKWAAVALLARVYLYQENWAKAEQLSSEVIGQAQLYSLEEKLDEVFLKESKEALWQGASHILNTNTAEANLYVTNNEHFLTQEVVDAFAAQDQRKANWLWLKDAKNGLYVPYKYKSVSTTGTMEHSIYLRLAELYLIRAEARMKTGHLTGAIADLDQIRGRADLSRIADDNPHIKEGDLADSIMAERQRELFAEWGHRWFDLKRTGKALTVLSVTKPGFTTSDLAYPIPESERLKNPNLVKIKP